MKLLPLAGSYQPSARVGEHVSAALSEPTKAILKVSYNRGADLMMCLVAVQMGSADCEQCLIRAFELFTGLGVSPESTFAFDGAGSDERDRAMPADMTTFLHGLAQQLYVALFRGGLPILGVDGTLAQTQPDAPAAGHVQAKTGSRAGGTPADQVLLTGLTLAGVCRGGQRSGRGRGDGVGGTRARRKGGGTGPAQRSDGRTVVFRC